MVNDILHTPPINPLMAGAGIANGVTSDMKNYGMTIAAMSQEAATLEMPLSSGIITAIMDDASDGTMNGMLGALDLHGMAA